MRDLRARLGVALPLLLLLAVFARSAAIGFTQRADGVTGNDPFTYVQTGLDIARTGSPLHHFALLERWTWQELGETMALLPLGYRPSCVRDAHSCSDGIGFFPLGLPLLLAAAYRLGGDGATYLVAPAVQMAALAAVALLGWHLAPGRGRAQRLWLAALPALFLSLSWRQNTHALAPNSDLPTQLFVTLAALAVVLSWRSPRRWLWPVLVGALLGAAYWMRHPAGVFLAAFVPFVGWRGAAGGEGGLQKDEGAFVSRRGIGLPWPTVQRLAALAAFFVVALPDLFYHRRIFGGWLAVENPDSSLALRLGGAPENLLRLAQRLAHPNEFSVLLLFAALGLFLLWREGRRRAAGLLAAWIALYLLFHLPLDIAGAWDNLARYMLPIFPAIALLAATGMVAGAGAPMPRPVRAGWLLLVLGAALVSGYKFVRLVDYRPFTYGHLTREQRLELEGLDEALGEDALLIVPDQWAGAVQLHAGLTTLTVWAGHTEAAWSHAFLGELQDELGKAFYLLAPAGDPSPSSPVGQACGEALRLAALPFAVHRVCLD
jgi:hypothetical protein